MFLLSFGFEKTDCHEHTHIHTQEHMHACMHAQAYIQLTIQLAKKTIIFRTKEDTPSRSKAVYLIAAFLVS